MSFDRFFFGLVADLEAISGATLTPYGLPCIRELMRFLITLINPLDKQNSDSMIHMGLSLLTIGLEVGADSIGKYDTLLEMMKDDLCRNLFAVSALWPHKRHLIIATYVGLFRFSLRILQLLSTERLTILAADLQVCFLLFESQRNCLKFHLEFYLNKLAELIGNENPRTPYEIRELALDNLLQFLRIPSFAAELYINYDCNLYCTNLLEDLVKLLSKNSLSATQAIYTIHDISLDGLMTIISDIEKNCSKQVVAKMIGGNSGVGSTGNVSSSAPVVGIIGGRHSRNNSSCTEKLALDNSKDSDLNATTTSGGEESGAVESIHTFINKKKHTSDSAIRTDTIDEHLIQQTATQTNADTITHDQLVEIKERKRVSFIISN